LSADLRELRSERALLASLNTPQGRSLAIVYLVLESPEAVLLVGPAANGEAILSRLAMFVLRARVSLTDVAQRFQAYAVRGAAACAGLRQLGELPGTNPLAVHHGPIRSVIRMHGPEDWMLVLQRDEDTAPDAAPAAAEAWELGRIRAGEPAVLPATRGAFVPQMLNLDLLGGISFSKGCYTGQEVIARTQHLGKIKRRMFRFRVAAEDAAPGTPVVADSDQAGTVVRSAKYGTGQELLAVISLAALTRSLRLGGADGPTLERLELPYSVPGA
jgi:folate-binding protein YgfZ